MKPIPLLLIATLAGMDRRWFDLHTWKRSLSTTMKPIRFLIIPLAFCLGLAACRTERKPARDVSQKHSDPESGSSPPPSQPEQHGNVQFSESVPEKPVKDLPAHKVRELSDDGKLLRITELERAEVFDVPVSTQVAKPTPSSPTATTMERPPG